LAGKSEYAQYLLRVLKDAELHPSAK